jgi:GT2 family glycosyltransferase
MAGRYYGVSPLVSIVIVHKDRYALLKACIESVVRYAGDTNIEIIVVDNGSSDGSVSRIVEELPSVRVISLCENVGFARGNNLGSKYATGRYLLFLNDDTLFIEDSLSVLLSFVEEHPELKIGAVGPILVDLKGNPVHSFGKFPSLIWQFIVALEKLGLLQRQLEAKRHKHGGCRNVDYVTGASLLVPRQVFTEMKGFEEDFFLYFEDTELQHRMSKAGYGRYVVERARVVHLCGGGVPRANGTRIETYKSYFLYYRRTHILAAHVLFLTWILTFIWCHLFNTKYSIRENINFIIRCYSFIFPMKRIARQRPHIIRVTSG